MSSIRKQVLVQVIKLDVFGTTHRVSDRRLAAELSLRYGMTGAFRDVITQYAGANECRYRVKPLV